MCLVVFKKIIHLQHTIALQSHGVGLGGAGAGAEGPHGALEALLEASQMGRQTLPRELG